MKKIILISLSIVVLILSGCTKEGFLEYNDIEYNGEFIFPVIKSGVSAEQITKIDNLQYDLGAFEGDIPFINVNLPVPVITGEDIGPLQLINVDSIFVYFTSDEAQIRIDIVNNFPINMKAGTRFEIRNSVLNNNVVFEGVLQNDIAEKGGTGFIEIEEVGTSPQVDNKLELFIVDFATDGSPVVEDFNTFNNVEISINLKIIQVGEVELFGGIDYSVVDTLEFEFGDQGNSNSQENSFVDGAVLVNLLIKNGTPLNYGVNVHFLDANFNVIRSLFSSSIIPAPPLDASGNVIRSLIEQQKISTEISEAEYNTLKDRTRYLAYNLGFNSQPENVIVTSVNDIDLHVTAFIKTKLNF